MQHDLVRVLLVVAGVALAPVVADGVGEDGAVVVEGAGGDGAADGRVALQAVLGDAVPEVKCAVGAGGAEGAVLRVEGDGVDGVDVRHVVLGWVAVAFEGEVHAGFCVSITREKKMLDSLLGIFLFHILDSTSTLNTPNRKSVCLGETANDSRLPLQRALNSLIKLRRLAEIDNIYITVCCSNN